MYRYIVAEIINAPGENSRHKIRARPLPGQWAGPEYRIECPTNIRKSENIGQFYRFYAKFKDTSTAAQLYTYHGWAPKRMTFDEAQAFIDARIWT
jgi:hypothetical protein